MENATRLKAPIVWRRKWLPGIALIGGNVALAVGPLSVRLATSGPVAAGFWRLALAVPVLMLLARANGERILALPRRTLGVLVLGGVVFAGDLAAWHMGIPRTHLANAAIFGNSSSVLLMAWALVGERRWPRRLEWCALAAALTGAAILLGRSMELSTRTLAGDLFCITAGVFYLFYLVLVRGARANAGTWAVLSVASACGAPVLLGFALMLGEPVWPGASQGFMHGGWWPLVTLALGSQVIGQGLLTYALRHFSQLVVGLALLTQPAVAVVVGWIGFHEVLTPGDVLGVLLVGAALVLARLGEG